MIIEASLKLQEAAASYGKIIAPGPFVHIEILKHIHTDLCYVASSPNISVNRKRHESMDMNRTGGSMNIKNDIVSILMWIGSYMQHNVQKP